MIYNDFCGIKISRLGFGCMRFPKTFEETKECIDYAYNQGVNYYDTAYVYNNSEVTLGKCLKDKPRNTYYVTSKLPIDYVKESEDVRRLVTESISRLQTGYIDFYLLHAMNGSKLEVVKKCHVMDELKKLKAEGLIRHIGFSIHASLDELKDILDYDQFEFAQIQLNYFDMVHAPGYAGYLELTKRNIPVIIMEPVKGGILANIPEEMAKPFRDYNAEYSNASYCFRFLLKYPNIKIILSGMSNFEQVKDNIATFNSDIKCDEKMEQVISQVKKNIESVYKVQCTNCRYCMPCPNGVNIPINFKVLNNRSLGKTFHDGWLAHLDYPKDAEYSKCINCGECLRKCPQHLNIPELLKLCGEE